MVVRTDALSALAPIHHGRLGNGIASASPPEPGRTRGSEAASPAPAKAPDLIEIGVPGGYRVGISLGLQFLKELGEINQSS